MTRFDATAWPVPYWSGPPRLRPFPMDSAAPDGAMNSGEAMDCEGLCGGVVSSCVSLEAEVPEVLFEGMRRFIRLNPGWDQYSLISAALAGFLFQNGCQDHQVTQHYLDGLFLRR